MPINLTIDGKAVQGEKGEVVLAVALRNGMKVPYFCYHPGLSLSGNCRMCMVRVTPPAPPPPKPGPDGKLPPAPPPPRPMLAISCMTQIAEGMTIETTTPDVLKAREGVMEFELLNHPLDCPTCDQAGECYLQDHSYNHGKSHGRNFEERIQKHTKQLGSTISLYGSRCIVCTRCVRFCDEISGTGELTVVNRGDHSVIDTFPGFPLENPLSMCTEDVCPVGALVTNDFLFQARVWFTRTTSTVCASCSVGCNINADVLAEKMVRLKPRTNLEVNDYWMCDHGRMSYKQQASPERLQTPRIDGKPATRAEAIQALHTRLASAGPSAAGLVSLWNTNEEMFLFGRVMRVLAGGAPIGVVERASEKRQQFKGGFVIEGDRNPNRAGAKAILGAATVDGGLADIVKKIQAGMITSLFVVNSAPEFVVSKELEEALGRLKFLGVMDVFPSPLATKAHVLLPATMHWEQDGTFVNVDGRVQRSRPVTLAAGDSAPAMEYLQEMLNRHPPGGTGLLSGDGVFRQIGAEVEEFREMTYRDVGELGIVLRAKEPVTR